MCITTRATISRGPGPGREANVVHEIILSMGYGVACIKRCIHILTDGGGWWCGRVLMINHASHMLECNTLYEIKTNNNFIRCNATIPE